MKVMIFPATEYIEKKPERQYEAEGGFGKREKSQANWERVRDRKSAVAGRIDVFGGAAGLERGRGARRFVPLRDGAAAAKAGRCVEQAQKSGN